VGEELHVRIGVQEYHLVDKADDQCNASLDHSYEEASEVLTTQITFIGYASQVMCGSAGHVLQYHTAKRLNTVNPKVKVQLAASLYGSLNLLLLYNKG
jgi:hypothetical protein